MDQFTLKEIKIKDFLSDLRYSSRYALEDDELFNSIKMQGLLQPVSMTQSSHQIIAGHKRIYALHALGVQSTQALVFRSSSPLTDKECFFLNLASNLGQRVSELDCFVSIKKAAQDFKFNTEELLALLRSFGLESKGHILKSYLNCLHYPSGILDLVKKGQLPFKGLDAFSHLSCRDLTLLTDNVLMHLSLNVNEVKILAGYLEQLKVVEKCGFEGHFAQPEFQEIMIRPDLDLKQKGQMFIAKVRQLQNPRLSEMESRFNKKVSALHCKALKIKAPIGFEDQGYSFELSLRDKKSLDELKHLIVEKEHLLNSLFDIML